MFDCRHKYVNRFLIHVDHTGQFEDTGGGRR